MVAAVSNPINQGERRQLTVLFCDLVGYTDLVGRLDPEDVRDAVRQYQQACVEHVYAHDGFVAQYLGDGLLVYFGYPEASEHAAANAVHAALAMIEAVDGLDLPVGKLKARIGIATGIAIVGDLLGEGASEFVAATGLAVNLASRIQSAVAEGCIGIARSTHGIVRGQFECTDIGLHQLKGIDEAVQLWTVKRFKVGARRMWRSGAHSDPMVGRDDDLDLLRTLWVSAKTGKLEAVTIWGEAGIGKSRLVAAFCDELPDHAMTMVLQCSPSNSLTPLYPVSSYIERAIARNAPMRGRRVSDAAHFFAPGEAEPDARLLASLLFPHDDDAMDISSFSGSRRKQLMLDLLVGRVLGLAKAGQLVIVVEDVQWCDPTTLELIEALRVQSAAVPLLLILTHRSGKRPASVKQDGQQDIVLRGLPDDVVSTLVKATAHNRIADAIVGRIVNRSDGNPLYAKEMARTLSIDDDGNLAASDVPMTLFDSFAARLDSLGAAKSIAQTAAVIGRRFSAALVGAVLGIDKSHLDAGFAKLSAAGVIAPTQGGDSDYLFHHALFQDVAYATLLRPKKREIHAQVADLLERSADVVLRAEPEDIARHWASSAEPLRAVPHLLAAGKNALERGTCPEAIGHISAALGMIDANGAGESIEKKAIFDLHLCLGQASYVTNGPANAETIAAYSKAQQLVDVIDDEDQRGMLLYGIFSSYHFASQFALAEGPAQRLLNLAEQSQHRVHQCLAHRMLGYLAFFRGHAPVAHHHFDQVKALYRKPDDGHLAAHFGSDSLSATEAFASVLDSLGGKGERAIARANSAIAHAESTGHPGSIGWAYAAACYVSFFIRDRPGTARISTEGVTFCEEHQIASWAAHCRLFQIWSSEHPTSASVQELITIAGAATLLGMPVFRGILAELLADEGQLPEALAEFDRALGVVDDYDQHVFESWLRFQRAQLLLRMGDGDRANDGFADALSAAQRYGNDLIADLSKAQLGGVLAQVNIPDNSPSRADMVDVTEIIARPMVPGPH